MKKSLSIIVFLIAISHNAYNQETKAFTEPLSKGDSKGLAVFFDNNIELSIINEDGIYSKKQAELILQRFFDKHQIISFSTKHEGGDLKRSKFLIGELKSKDHLFRCHILFRKVEEKLQIIELRIELED